MMSERPLTPSTCLVLHPLARPAFEVLAELGAALIPTGAARAVAGPDRTDLVFAGLPWLWSGARDVPLPPRESFRAWWGRTRGNRKDDA